MTIIKNFDVKWQLKTISLRLKIIFFFHKSQITLDDFLNF